MFGARPEASRTVLTRRVRSGPPSRGASTASTSPLSCLTLDTNVFVTSSIPSSVRTASSSAAASGSDRAPRCSIASTIVTLEPKRENACPNSSPTAPPPTTSSDSGSSVSSSALM